MIDHEPNNRTGFIAGVTAWSLVALSAGFGLIAIASCGIPFVPPASTLAIVFGAMGCLAAVAAVVFAFLSGRTATITFVVIGGVLLMLNGFAIYLGQLGKHLIDYLEGH